MDTNTTNAESSSTVNKWSFFKKFFVWVTVVVVIVLAILIWVGNNTAELTKKIEKWRAERYEQALQKYTDEMKARYTADTNGGKTPEETIELFITALKAGDIEKASKYYVLEKQEATLADLRNDLEKSGDLSQSIKHFIDVSTKGVKKCNKKIDGCTFEYVYTETATTTYNVVGMNQKIVVPAGEKTTEAVDVGLNHQSGVWKIELP